MALFEKPNHRWEAINRQSARLASISSGVSYAFAPELRPFLPQVAAPTDLLPLPHDLQGKPSVLATFENFQCIPASLDSRFCLEPILSISTPRDNELAPSLPPVCVSYFGPRATIYTTQHPRAYQCGRHLIHSQSSYSFQCLWSSSRARSQSRCPIEIESSRPGAEAPRFPTT